jgi:hypothetical protein
MKNILFITSIFAVFACNQKGSDNSGSSVSNDATEQVSINEGSEGQNIDPDVITNKESASGHKGKPAEPVFKFEEEEWDFGTITEGAKVSHTFRFKNVGNAPLVIQSATASCGCTIPKFSKEPIAPGEEGKIPVEFDSKGKESQITKDINIIANTNPVQKIIRIKVNVVPKK